MDPLIPKSIQNAADAAGLSWNEYLNTLSPAEKADAEEQITVYDEIRRKQIEAAKIRNAQDALLSSPLTPVVNPALFNTQQSAAQQPPTPTIEELEAGSTSPVLSTAPKEVAQADPLLAVTSFQNMAKNTGQTPEQYLASLDETAQNVHRQILLGVNPETPAPVLESATVPEGFHRMPDGSIMANSEMSAPVLESGPAAGVGEEPGVLMRSEQNLAQKNIGERQLLEGRIADLEGSVDTQADVARLQQMKQQLIDLGGSVESNQSTTQYDDAAQIYSQDLRQKQEQAAAVAPDVRAAEAEIASSEGLLSSGTLPPEMMASVQARKAAAEAALASGNTARDTRVAEVTSRTLSLDNPVNGNVANNLGPVLQANPNEQPGADPAMFTPVPVLTPNPSAIGAADPYAPPDRRFQSTLDRPEPGMNGASDYSNPVLIDTTTPTTTTDNTTANITAPQLPALSSAGSTATRAPALSRGAGNMTSNARGSSLGMVPRGESLIRIGGAMYSGALQGDGLGAATREYGSIQDANRAAEVAAAKQAEATRLAELRARGTGAGKAGSKATKGAGDLRFGISKLQTALGMIRGSDGSLTGLNPSALFDRFMGKTIGNEQEAQRLFLNEIGLDSIMKRVAETKGAISNAEMALFGRQVPQIGSQEIVWERWLQRQMQMAELLLARAEGGGTVDPNAPLSETMPGLSGGGGAGSSNMSAADAIVGI